MNVRRNILNKHGMTNLYLHCIRIDVERWASALSVMSFEIVHTVPDVFHLCCSEYYYLLK